METSQVICLVYTKKGFDRPAGFYLMPIKSERDHYSSGIYLKLIWIILSSWFWESRREYHEESVLTFPTLNKIKSIQVKEIQYRWQKNQALWNGNRNRASFGLYVLRKSYGKWKPKEFFHITPFTAIRINKMHTGHIIHIIASFSA